MNRTTLGAVACFAVLVALAGSATGAVSSAAERLPASHGLVDVDPEDCLQIPPEDVPPLAVSMDEKFPLEIRVLAEARDLTTVKRNMKVTKGAFARIGLPVKLRYQTVVAPDEWTADTSFGGGPAQAEILDFMKSIFGGERPSGVDVVYFMTQHWDGGFADCIGGIRAADRAFAFGSVEYAIEGVVPSPTVDEGAIAAHEIGHLLGAHHHYANCAEALPSGAIRGDTNPCTTMWPLAASISSTFGLLERSFIRSYAAAYAKG
nr:hypothetical protein [Actinomycetota bacterium]